MKLASALVALFSASPASSYSPPSCQAVADDYCAKNCLDSASLQARSCDGPMVALESGPGESKRRCYSPSTLSGGDATAYEAGDCYCTRDAELSSLLKQCERDMEIETVFAAGMDNAACYRIPSIIMTPDGALLAFAEQREKDCGDNGTNNIVVRRKEKGGVWGEIRMVAKADGQAYSNANPAIVYDAAGGWSVLLHYDTMNNPSSSRVGANMQTWSEDGGKTWSEAADITGFMPDASKGCMPGPSIGVQNNVPGHAEEGRVYFNCHSGNAGGNAGGNHIAYWSDDLGATWEASEPLGSNFNECSIALLPSSNSSLLLNCRTNAGDPDLDDGKARAEMLLEGGSLAGDAFYPAGLDDPGCAGSIVSRKGAEGEDVVLLSNAVGPGRSNLRVKTSVDSGRTFDDGVLVWDGPAAYSMLVDGGDFVGVFFELGADSPYESMGFAVVA
ncbi:hypothetical protein TeGR_g6389 [Tetraparma gracilis]|uniref:Sialidase domain-containing protein n=1 Tax=Tetraparma gracilis TaxID=2962635 RepID=A0ABQ6MF22_9STRA|nr:hypothetical protein TeGR_g6389 [Tetraparma gracilis]